MATAKKKTAKKSEPTNVEENTPVAGFEEPAQNTEASGEPNVAAVTGEQTDADKLAQENAELKQKLAEQEAEAKGPQIAVRATARGYYGQLREVGDVFHIYKKEDMGSWMELYQAPTGFEPKQEVSPDKETTGDEAVI